MPVSTYAAIPKVLRAPFRFLYSHVPFPWNMGGEFARLYRSFERAERLSREAIETLQLNHLRRVFQEATSSVPAYRKQFSELGVFVNDIQSLADWARLPITTKEDLRQNADLFVNSDIASYRILKHRTSGSTGTPVEISSTRRTWIAERAAMYRGWRWIGMMPGDRIATCVGGVESDTKLGEAPFVRYRNQLDLSSSHLDLSHVQSYLNLLREFSPHYIRTYPFVAKLLGHELRKGNLSLPSLKGILTQSETLTPALRSNLQTLWNAPIFDHYGMQEKCASMSECLEGSLHVHSDFCFVELIPDSSTPYHRVIATGFFNSAMPLIRYETGDFASPAEQDCRCGLPLPAVRNLVGRIEDQLYDPDGRLIPDLDQAIIHIRHIKQCQVIQERIDFVRVCVLPDEAFGSEDERALLTTIQNHLGPKVKVSLERVSEIPRTRSGKVRFIVSRVSRP